MNSFSQQMKRTSEPQGHRRCSTSLSAHHLDIDDHISKAFQQPVSNTVVPDIQLAMALCRMDHSTHTTSTAPTCVTTATVEETDDAEEKSRLLRLSTATRPYIPEESCLHCPAVMTTTVVDPTTPQTVAFPAAAAALNHSITSTSSAFAMSVPHALPCSSLRQHSFMSVVSPPENDLTPSAQPAPSLNASIIVGGARSRDVAVTGAVEGEGEEGQTRLLPSCLAYSPTHTAGLMCCLEESMVAATTANTSPSTVHHCGITETTISGHSAQQPSAASRFSLPSASLRVASSDTEAAMMFVVADADVLTCPHRAISARPSPYPHALVAPSYTMNDNNNANSVPAVLASNTSAEGGRAAAAAAVAGHHTFAKARAYGRFERAVQARPSPPPSFMACGGGEWADEDEAMRLRDAALLYAADHMSKLFP